MCTHKFIIFNDEMQSHKCIHTILLCKSKEVKRKNSQRAWIDITQPLPLYNRIENYVYSFIFTYREKFEKLEPYDMESLAFTIHYKRKRYIDHYLGACC